MIFDREKNVLVTQLKKLRGLKDKTQYQEMKKGVAKKYNVTPRAVEMWINQRTPGARKVRNDAGKVKNKITAKEKKVAAELLEQGMKVKDVKEMVSEKTGKPISTRKLNRVRDQVNMGAEAEIENGDMEKESNFGDEAKDLFRRLFELDLIAPGRGISLNVGKKKFVIPKVVVEDVCLILANAYNDLSTENKFKVDRDEVRKIKMFALLDQQMRLASTERVDTKTVEAITRMYDRMKEDQVTDANIKVVVKVCEELRPGISFTEVFGLIRKHSDSSDGD